jgi:hypothetical protein
MSALLWIHAVSRAIGFGVVASAARSDEGRRSATARREHSLRVLRRYWEVRVLAGLRTAPAPTTTGT